MIYCSQPGVIIFVKKTTFNFDKSSLHPYPFKGMTKEKTGWDRTGKSQTTADQACMSCLYGIGVLKWFRWCQTGPYGTLLCDLYGLSFRNGSGKSLIVRSTADSARLSCRHWVLKRLLWIPNRFCDVMDFLRSLWIRTGKLLDFRFKWSRHGSFTTVEDFS